LFSAYLLSLSLSNIINMAQTRAKNSRHQMAPASAVKVTATKKKAGKAVCEGVADKGLKKQSTWINNDNCEIRRGQWRKFNRSSSQTLFNVT
jgi:hypothetical protein